MAISYRLSAISLFIFKNHHFRYRTKQVYTLCFHLDAAITFPDFFLFLENSAIFERENGVFRQLLYGMCMVCMGVVPFQHAKQMQICTAGSRRVVHVLDDSQLDIVRENAGLDKRLHELPESCFPFLSMRLYPMLIYVPCFQMGKFVYSSDQECIGVEIVVYRYAMPLAPMWWPVITKLRRTAPAYPKKAWTIVNPLRNDRGGRGWHILA